MKEDILKVAMPGRLYHLLRARTACFVLALVLILLGSGHVNATPSAIHALDPEKSFWRNNYKDRLFSDIHRYSALTELGRRHSENHLLTEAVEERLKGEWQNSIDKLKDLLANVNDPDIDETIYTTGLVYESLGFYPEALGNYSRLIGAIEKGDYYRKATLRSSLVKFISSLTSPSVFKLIDADSGFYRVYRESEDQSEWTDALAGHALMLYVFKDFTGAEKLFDELDSDEDLNPAYQLARAENYLNLDLPINAMKVLEKLIKVVIEDGEDELIGYLYLRLGDTAVLRGDMKLAASYYEKMPKGIDPEGKIASMESFLMREMAHVELHISEEKNMEAINKLRVLIKKGPLPPDLGLDKTAYLYLVDLYKKERLWDDAFRVAKEYLLLHPESKWDEEVRAYVNKYIFDFTSGRFALRDFQGVIEFYYENGTFVRETRSYLIAGNAFLKAGLPSEAKVIFDVLAKSDKDGWRALTGLASSHTMLGEPREARLALKAVKAKTKEGKHALALSARELGDHYYLNDEPGDALFAYGMARSVIKDPELDYLYARLLAATGEAEISAIEFENILKASPRGELKLKATVELADVYFGLKRWDDALRLYGDALELAEKDKRAFVYYKIGESNHNLGNGLMAIDAWNKAVALGLEGEFTKVSIERLKEADAWEKSRM